MNKYILAGVVVVLILAARLVPAAQQDFSKVEIKTQKLPGSVYMLEGAGGNIGVSAGPDGVLVIDDQFAPLADKIKAAVKGISDKPMKFLLNTHYHGDHTGGNEIFGREALVIAQTNVRTRLVNQNKAQSALPVVTYDNSVSLHFNGEEIKISHYPNGHTDGDSVIYFTKSNVAHLGDDFTPGRYPIADLGAGGDVEGLARNLGMIINSLPADVTVIPGHGPLSKLDDVRKYRTIIAESTDFVRKQMAAGKSLDQIKAEGFPASFAQWGPAYAKSDNWVQTVYNSLSRKK